MTRSQDMAVDNAHCPYLHGKPNVKHSFGDAMRVLETLGQPVFSVSVAGV